MNKIKLSFVFYLLMVLPIESSEETILGYWLTSESIVEIKVCAQNICAQIEHIFVEEGEDPFSILDTNNRDEDLRNRTLIGINLLDGFKEDQKLDFLILDEAQDLINPNFLEVFDSILKEGIRNGKWIMFGDFSNQAIYADDSLKIFELLNSYTSFTSKELVDRMDENDVPSAIINKLDEVIDDPQVTNNKTIISITKNENDSMQSPRSPAQFSSTPCSVDHKYMPNLS